MGKLAEYIAFDLELSMITEKSHIIQVSTAKFKEGHEVDGFDTYIYTDVSLQSFINGLAGITSKKIANALELDEVLVGFKTSVGETALVGYNALKSGPPLLAGDELDSTELYKVGLHNEAFEHRNTDLDEIVNLGLTSVAEFLGISGHGHSSFEGAHMIAPVYEKFMEFDENRSYLDQQEEEYSDNPFATLDGFPG